MKTIHRLPNRATAEKEAGAWIARLHADDTSPEDLERFKDWCEAHSSHARLFEEMAASIDEVKRAGRIVRAVDFGNAMNSAGQIPSPKRWNSYRGMFAVVACVAMVTIVVWWVQRSLVQTMFQTAVGERASVELPDGSRLDLNSQSTARVVYRDDARVIYLSQGEAYFKVARDPTRPFWVVAGNSWVRALGTAFDVEMHPSGVRVTVSEGTVKVAAVDGAATPSDASLSRAPVSVLSAGQQAELRSGSARIRPATPAEFTRLAAWRKGKLYFENRTLESVVEELGRYTTASITVEDETLRQLPIGGTFQANPQGVEALLALLQEGFGLRVRRVDDSHVYIESAPAVH